MAIFGKVHLCVTNFLFIITVIINKINGDSATQVYTGCKNLDDGVQWVRPIAGNKASGEEYPNIQVRCSGGWAILDYSLDSYISEYFTSFTSWTEYAASSSIDDRVTWSEWFLPSNENTKFAVSADCHTCASSSKEKDYAAFFMTGNYIGCLWITKGMCDMDSSSLECYECSTSSGKKYSGLCTHIEKSADTEVYEDHDLCTTNNFNLIPSIGTNGQYCVCYQQEEEVLVDAGSSFDREDKSELGSVSAANVELYADDFTQGTYRITTPGYYKLMEDVELNMNAPDNFDSPNAEGAWYPTSEQNVHYEGSDDSFVGAFSMGFFAAFTVECSDVTIDLNGYELKMSKEFYLQQRWFSIIEIGSKAFISGQGPGNFGAFLTSSNNVVIQNGILGLTSHHSIHGNSASDITIQDMTIRDFEVAGIALNGFTNVIIQNVEVGPSFKEVPVLGVYTQARIMLPRLRKVAEDNPDGIVKFHARSENKILTMSEIKDNLEQQMNAIFAHVIQGVEYDENDPVWQNAKELFINENNIPSASTVYGIFLNSLGASVFAVGGAPGYSYNAVVKNVKIHNLINDPWEVPRIMNVKGPFNDIFDATRVTDNGMTDLSTVQYVGSAYTDAQYALHELTNSWAVLSHSALTDDVVEWIANGQSLEGNAKLQCNNDIMLHVTKGIFGLRIDSVDTFQIDNVEIEDLQNIGYYGSLVCGHYTSEDDGGHRNQRAPMQYGYTGTEVHAVSVINSKGTIDNLSIRRIISARGDAAGLRLYPGNELTLGTITISDIHAGAYAKSTDALLSDEDHLPNKVPRACGIDHWTYSNDDDDTLALNSITYDESKISVSCMTYMAGCSWDYSAELTSNYVEQCSTENGNLFNTEDIATYDSVYQAIEASKDEFYVGIVSKLEDQVVLNEDISTEGSTTSQKTTPQVPIWVYVIVAVFGFLLMLSVIFKKCYKSKKTAIFVSTQRLDMRNYNTMNNEKLPLLSQQL